MISSVFSRMFNAEFCEKDADEVDLTTDESLKADVFKAFIEAVYPDRVGPNGSAFVCRRDNIDHSRQERPRSRGAGASLRREVPA